MMAYYISNEESNLGISHVKKRLGDFKGVEGKTYHVRKKQEVPEGLFHVPIYIYEDGKLKPTKRTSVYGLL